MIPNLLQKATHQALRHFQAAPGTKDWTLRRYVETPDPVTGSTSRTLAESIQVIGTEVDLKPGTVEGQRHGDRKLILSGLSMGASPPLDGSWVAVQGSKEYSIVGRPVSTGVGGVNIVWEVVVRKGAGAGG